MALTVDGETKVSCVPYSVSKTVFGAPNMLKRVGNRVQSSTLMSAVGWLEVLSAVNSTHISTDYSGKSFVSLHKRHINRAVTDRGERNPRKMMVFSKSAQEEELAGLEPSDGFHVRNHRVRRVADVPDSRSAFHCGR